MSNFKVINSGFVLSAPDLSFAPPPVLPEVALIGRSNVGKSTLVNGICGRQKLARSGKTPGLTKYFNYFEVTFRDEDKIDSDERCQFYLLDMPGYGFAAVSKSEKRDWLTSIDEFLLGRPNLANTLLLVDIRRDLGEEELSVIEAINPTIVLTKGDKLSTNEALKRKAEITKEFPQIGNRVYVISSLIERFSIDRFTQDLLTDLEANWYK